MTTKTLYVVLALFSAACTVQAQAKERTGTETLAQLQDKLRQHPEIAAYVQRAESSGYSAEGELGLPDPMIFIQEQDYPLGSSMSRAEEQKMIGFKQEIPALGTRRAASERMGVESRKNKLLGEYALAAMNAKMITALAHLERIDAQEQVLKSQAALFGSERASLKGRIAANQAGVSELTMSEAESTEIELMRTDLQEERHENEAMLMNMLGEVPQIAPPPMKQAAWNRDAEATYPVAIARADRDMAQKDVELREAEYNPNIELQANYGRMNGGDNAGTLMVGMTIPLWAEQSQKPKLAGAKAAVAAAASDQEMIRRQTVEKMTHLEAQIAASARKLKLLKRKESLLASSGGAQVREYEAGKGAFTLPLKTRREVLSVRYQKLAEEAKHTALIAEFNRYLMQEGGHE